MPPAPPKPLIFLGLLAECPRCHRDRRFGRCCWLCCPLRAGPTPDVRTLSPRALVARPPLHLGGVRAWCIPVTDPHSGSVVRWWLADTPFDERLRAFLLLRSRLARMQFQDHRAAESPA